MTKSRSTKPFLWSILTLLLLTAAFPSAAPTSVLIWSDEFDAPGLPDAKRWGYDVGGDGGGNREAQLYTQARAANARIDSGILRLTARREDTGTCWYGPCKFTSARLVTRGLAAWTYGRVEVRARLPRGKGLWPAIWMLPQSNLYGNWPNGGEIDIMENVGYEPATVHGTVHTEAYNHVIGTQKGSSISSASIADSFHVYGLDWRPDSLFITLDGKAYFAFKNEGQPSKWPFQQPFYLLLNVAVGGEWGGQQGVDTAVFPQSLLVDWVRVSKVAWQPGPFRVTPRASEGGHVQVTPSLESYPALSRVTLEAKADSGWEFFAWDSGGEKPQSLDTVILERDLVARARFLPAGERVANGDFQNGLAGWTFWHDAALPSAMQWREGALCAHPGGIDAASPWKTQVSWPGLTVKAGEAYDLRFSLRASASRNVVSTLVQDGDPFATLASWTTQASSQWQSRSHRFAVNASHAKARLEFDLAGDTSEICFDSVSLRKVSSGTPVAYPMPHFSQGGPAHWQIRAGGLWLQSHSSQVLHWRLSRAQGSQAFSGKLAPGQGANVLLAREGRGLWVLALSGDGDRRPKSVKLFLL